MFISARSVYTVSHPGAEFSSLVIGVVLSFPLVGEAPIKGYL